jgi:hypothetical protein
LNFKAAVGPTALAAKGLSQLTGSQSQSSQRLEFPDSVIKNPVACLYTGSEQNDTDKLRDSLSESFRNALSPEKWPSFLYISPEPLPNILFLHFANLKKDLPGEIRRIAEFLNIEIEPNKFDLIVEKCTFKYMKKNAENHKC